MTLSISEIAIFIVLWVLGVGLSIWHQGAKKRFK